MIEKIIEKIIAGHLAMIKRIFTDLPKELQECVQCHLALPMSEFYKRPCNLRGYTTTCKKCIFNLRKARPSYKYYNTTYAKQYRKDNPRTVRGYYFKYKYGITADDYDSMYAGQGGCCLICGKHKDKLVIDHDHISGVVRGLLCSGCNTAMGQFQDNVDILTKAIEYIKGHSTVECQIESPVE